MALKPSVLDLTVDELHERRNLVKAELKERFKKTKPFRKEPVSPAEALYYYNQLTPEKMQGLLETYGRDEVNEMIYEMEKIKQKRGGR